MTTRAMRGFSSANKAHIIGLAPVVLAVLLAGCMPVPSLSPLITEEESIFDPQLLGEWRAPQEAGDFALHFQRSGERSYRLAYEDGSSVSIYDARVGRLGDHLVMNVTLGRVNAEQCLPQDAYPHYLPLHTFYRVEVDDGQLTLFFFSHEWVRKGISRGEISVPHASLDELVLLTAAPAELQELMRRHAEDKKAFTALGPLRRVTSEGN